MQRSHEIFLQPRYQGNFAGLIIICTNEELGAEAVGRAPLPLAVDVEEDERERVQRHEDDREPRRVEREAERVRVVPAQRRVRCSPSTFHTEKSSATR